MVNLSDVLEDEVLRLGACEVVVVAIEGSSWESVSARVWPLVVTSVVVVV